MFTVYVLQDSIGKLYKRMTSDLKKRLRGHRTGDTKTTRAMDEIKVVYTKTFETAKKARKYEKYLKSAAGRRFLKK
jgi:putative endonuclease